MNANFLVIDAAFCAVNCFEFLRAAASLLHLPLLVVEHASFTACIIELSRGTVLLLLYLLHLEDHFVHRVLPLLRDDEVGTLDGGGHEDSVVLMLSGEDVGLSADAAFEVLELLEYFTRTRADDCSGYDHEFVDVVRSEIS